MDTALARREAAHGQMELSTEIIGYRRVIRPELSKSGTCGLCVAASDREYKRGDLLPLHDRCKCIVLPIIADIDPGVRLNQDDLDRLKADAGSNSAKDLKRTRYRVDEHGEIGPYLLARHHRSR